MADIVNLNRARKAKARAQKEAQATANRAKFGRTGAERAADRLAKERRRALLDGARMGGAAHGEEEGGKG